MGLRGFSVLLAPTATKEDCIEVKLHRAIVMLNTAPPPPLPPSGREGYSLMWTILGFAARQDTAFVLCP